MYILKDEDYYRKLYAEEIKGKKQELLELYDKDFKALVIVKNGKTTKGIVTKFVILNPSSRGVREIENSIYDEEPLNINYVKRELEYFSNGNNYSWIAGKKSTKEEINEYLKNDYKGLKVCRKCGIGKHYDEFYAHRNSPDGLAPKCKECTYKALKENRSKEKTKKIQTKRKERIESLQNTLTDKQWNNIIDYFNNSCAYCGKTNCKLQKEHIVPVSNEILGTTAQNIIPACISCNSSKNNKDFFEWYSAQPFFDKDRYEKIKTYKNYDYKKM